MLCGDYWRILAGFVIEEDFLTSGYPVHALNISLGLERPLLLH